MEEVLYDLSLAEAKMNDHYAYFGNDSLRKQLWLNLILEKHRITEADLDTSLVWYNQNLDIYLKINQRVVDRLQILADTLTRRINRKNQDLLLIAAHNFFPDTTSFFLRSPGWFQNTHSYKVEDYAFLTSRNFCLSMNVLGVTPSVHPILSLSMHTPDSVWVQYDTLRINGFYAKTFPVPANYQLQALSGSFEIPDTVKALVLFYQIRLSDQAGESLSPVSNELNYVNSVK